MKDIEVPPNKCHVMPFETMKDYENGDVRFVDSASEVLKVKVLGSSLSGYIVYLHHKAKS